nr:MAG TPA: DNA binding protein [Microviridae sp.]
MMIKIFSVFDKKASAFMSPFYFNNIPEALRAFDDICNDVNSRINKHPGDYALYLLGSFDDKSGEIRPEAKPLFVEDASAMVVVVRPMNIDGLVVKEA